MTPYIVMVIVFVILFTYKQFVINWLM